MSALLPLLRAAHYGATFYAAGALVFAVAVAAPADLGAARRLARAVALAAAIAVLSGLAWLVAEAANMSGRSFAASFDPSLLIQVARATEFGRVWVARLIVLAVLAVPAFLPPSRGNRIAAAAGALAATASLAFAGHAAAESKLDLAADMVHLICAAFWLGSLVPLALLLARAARATEPSALAGAHRATRRFSVIGAASVGGLLMTGILSAWTLVGSPPALLGTGYGRILLVKIALFFAMVAVAAINRQRLTPRLEDAGARAGAAARALARNAWIETALGALILIDVGWLGISVPGAHDEVLWPLPVTWSLDATAGRPVLAALAVLAAAAAIVGLVALARAGLETAPRRGSLVLGAALLAGGIAVAGVAMSEPAVPTVYVASPLPYSVATIAAGARHFAEDCAICHGAQGYGDGPGAANLPEKPTDLARGHLAHHSDGTIFWWIGNGIPDTPMPDFAELLDPRQRFEVVAFLHANADAESARLLGAKPDPDLRIAAPDFAFEPGGGAQETLAAQRGQRAVLLVLYKDPGDQRLAALAAARVSLAQAGLRIVAAPLGDAAAGAIFTPPDRDLAAVYGLYRRLAGQSAIPPLPDRMEFLIDRWGYLRARWMGADAAPPDALAAMMMGMALEPEPPPPTQTAHHH